MTIHLALASDNNYLKHLATTLASVLKNNPEEIDLNIYILSNDISEKNLAKLKNLQKIRKHQLEIISVDQSLYQNLTETHHTMNMYFRLHLPTLLPHLDKIIYLDSDIIVRSSLRQLWDTDLDGKILAGSLDSLMLIGTDEQKQVIRWNKTGYLNSGVLLMNLDEMRKQSFEKRIIEWILENPDLNFPDQDAINAVFFEQFKTLPICWNFQFPLFIYPEIEKSPKIIHYTTTNKPWKLLPDYPWRREYWEYRKMTPWSKGLPENRSLKAVLSWFKSKLN